MGERILVQGNEAVCWGALAADCEAFFGYPITPQNEIIEWMSREFPSRGKVFVQAQDEIGAIGQVYGASAAGFRAMTSTASPGWDLMLETMSNAGATELPYVVVMVQRGGYGQATTRHTQMDYASVCKGGGHGGYKNIVLAPHSVQETYELMPLAFHLADKYRNPVVVLSDAIIGQMREVMEFKSFDVEPLPKKGWAVRGLRFQEDGKRRSLHPAIGVIPLEPPLSTYRSWQERMVKKIEDMQSELRYELYRADDAKLLIVAFGYGARVSKEAIRRARAQGIKVGLLRPITLWPFPAKVIKEKAGQGIKFLVVEDNLGLMVEDVRAAAEGRAEVNFLGMLSRDLPTDGGMLMPGIILEGVKRLL